ncbi:unnamed protein product [Closterium sp. NIES-53]
MLQLALLLLHQNLLLLMHIKAHKTAKALHDAVVARYSSPPTAALGYLILPYLFPELSAFATVEDLITHLRTSDTRYRATLTAKFLGKNPPPMYITLYFIVTHLPDSLRAVRDHFLALDPTYLTIDLLEKHLLATETSEVTVGAARGTPRTPFFEGLVLLLLGSVATARAREARVVEVAAGVVVVEAVEAVEVAEVAVGVVAGVGASVASVVATVRVVVAVVAAVGVVAAAVVEVRVELFRGEVLEVAGGSSSSVRARPLRPSSFGILQSFTLPASPMQNRVAERRIGLFMEVARTSMIHAAPPHFLWPFAVRYTAHQLSLWPRVSLPETSPTLRLTGKVDDASVFRVRGFHAFVSDTSADKLSSYAILCVFLGFPPDEPSWQFYHPTSRRVLSSQDFTFEESVPIYRLFSYRTAPPAPPRPPRVGATLQFAFGLLSVYVHACMHGMI